MKKQLLSFVLLGTIAFQGFSQAVKRQIAVDSKEYEEMKASGTPIPEGLIISNPQGFTPNLEQLKSLGVTHAMSSTSGCSCYIAPDATYTLAMPPNDDGSTALLSIPFTFCLYGTNYTSLYINNNGNVSFVSPYITFSAAGFPSPSYVMVAPFWGDVDTRGAGAIVPAGTVKYKITPTAMYVNWTGVGYFPNETDKLNTFQLIITDGTDPVLPPGDNVAFCYGDMQWTTGSASGGSGGFGGTPATVGVNKGDGINYIQMGRFDHAGASYDGGYGLSDGVSWLDNQSFYFNTCSGNNIAPIASITPPLLSGGGGGGCDTLRLCGTGDTLVIGTLFLSPEIGQTTTVGINLYGVPGLSVLTNSPGNPASSQVQIIASPANAGLHTITYTAVDDGVPAQTTVINLNIFIDTTGLAAFNPHISGVLEFCEGGSTTLSVSPTTFDSYIWNTGSTTTSTTVDSTGNYWVTSRKGQCYKTTQVHVTEDPLPTPVIAGYPYACGGSTTLTVDSLIYSSYAWSTTSTNDSVTVGLGTYTVTVTDSNGCVGTSPAVTVVAPVPPVISGVTVVCNGDLAQLTTTIPYVTYSWTSGTTNDTATVPVGTYSVTVVDINGCTITSAPFTVNPFNFTLNATGVAPYCVGHTITLNAAATPSSGASFVWSTAATTPSITVGSAGTYAVTLTYPNGCTTDTTFTVAPPNPLPTPAITGYLFTCGTTPTTLGIDSTSLYTSYLWSTASTNATIPALVGTFTVTVTDHNGCTATATATVVNANPTVSISGAAPFCPGSSISLTANPSITSGAAYVWSNSTTTATTTISSPGSYSVVVNYPSGCSAADTISVTEFSPPVANFTSTPPSPSVPGVPVNFTDMSSVPTGSIVGWTWYFGDSTGVIGSTAQNPTHFYSQDGTYSVMLVVLSSNGCLDTVRFDYVVISNLVIPNVFTPNNDGQNDVLAFKNLEYKPGSSLQVFNRWGNKVYESSNYQNNWNGDKNSDGVYYFILDGPKFKSPVTGFVQILH